MRKESITGRYYLKPFITKLKIKGWKQDEIAELFDCSVSTLKYTMAYDTPVKKPEIEQLFGMQDDEFLRVVAELRCMAFLAHHGWQSGKTDAKCVFDVFAIKNDQTIRIQVRSTSSLSVRGWPVFDVGKITYNTKGCKRSVYNSQDFDFWFFYHKNGDAWIIPFDKVTNSSAVSMEGFDEYHIDD